ncbi:MAG: hypothetical protein WCR08_10410 [Gammaproteobacteria bacterium]
MKDNFFNIVFIALGVSGISSIVNAGSDPMHAQLGTTYTLTSEGVLTEGALHYHDKISTYSCTISNIRLAGIQTPSYSPLLNVVKYYSLNTGNILPAPADTGNFETSTRYYYDLVVGETMVITASNLDTSTDTNCVEDEEHGCFELDYSSVMPVGPVHMHEPAYKYDVVCVNPE